MFTQQRAALDGRNSAAASIHLLTRLLRHVVISATDCTPRSTRIQQPVRLGAGQADWNPRDGDLRPLRGRPVRGANGTIWKREPADAGLVSFGDRVQSLTFTYTNQNGAPLTNVAKVKPRPDLIGGVNVTIVTTPGPGLPSVTSTSAISLRKIK